MQLYEICVYGAYLKIFIILRFHKFLKCFYALLRLSEAMARLHCLEAVLPKHVKEAARLLNKSIIRVETPDINFIEEASSAGLNLLFTF